MNDVFGIVGFASVVGGVAVIHWPTALIVGGAILITLSLIGAFHDSRSIVQDK